jgi:hypothetical protein
MDTHSIHGNLEDYIDPVAAAVSLDIVPRTRPALVAALQLLAEMAEQVMEFPLAGDAKPAKDHQP